MHGEMKECKKRKRTMCQNQECAECVQKSFASHERSVFWSIRNEVSPREVFKSAVAKRWFSCGECQHDFQISLNHVSAGKWCSYCCNHTLCDDSNCTTCFNKSFLSHPKSVYWSKKNEVSPRQVLSKSHAKFWFRCDKCPHEFEKQVSTVARGGWCPFCPNQLLCDDEQCGICFTKSFASNKKALQWSDRNNLRPRQVLAKTHAKVWFVCEKCPHEFQKILSDVSTTGSWCPFCSNQLLCDDESCVTCFEKSFASNEKASQWSDRNDLKPRQVFRRSGIERWFRCDRCDHDFSMIPSNVYTGHWCGRCMYKTGVKLHNHLLTMSIDWVREFRRDWCRGKSLYRFDFALEAKKVLIELDGAQHFTQVSNWTSVEENKERDLYKTKSALNNGYSIIRIVQEDVYSDKYDWKTELNAAIAQASNSPTPVAIFLCKKGEYDELRLGIQSS